MVPKQRGKGGKQGSFTYNYIFDAFCDLKLLASLRNFKSTSVGVLFLIKLQIFSSNCSEEILLWRCFWGFVFGLIVSNRKTHHMMSFVSAFFFFLLIFNEKVISVFTSTAKPCFLVFTKNSKCYFFTSFMVPFWAHATLRHIITGISLGCPWCSTWAKYFYSMGTRFASYHSFSFSFRKWCNPSGCQTLYQMWP